MVRDLAREIPDRGRETKRIMKAQPLVLIHGMWCTGHSWDTARRLFEARGYDCLAPTLPGHEPTSDQPLRVARLGLSDYVQALRTQIEAQGYERPPILLGHSMGALLAQQLALQLRPLAMVLLTPAPGWGINGLSLDTVRAFAPWMLSGPLWRRSYKPDFERTAAAAFNTLPADRRRMFYESMVHEAGRAIAQIAFWWLDGARASHVDASRIDCPVYVVSCGKDRLTPAAVVRKVASAYPRATLRHYPDRGHWVIDDEHTEEMVHGICGWLQPLQKRSSP